MSALKQQEGFTIEHGKNGILIIKLNRPQKKNAVKLATYGKIAEGTYITYEICILKFCSILPRKW